MVGMNIDAVAGLSFCEVPDDGYATGLAVRVGDAVLRENSSPTAAGIVGLFGWRYRRRVLCGGDSSMAVPPKAILVPLLGGGFSVLVNDALKPSDEEELWLVGHELCHSFFYNRGVSPPRRIIPSSEKEERFCDLFADSLVSRVGVLRG